MRNDLLCSLAYIAVTCEWGSQIQIDAENEFYRLARARIGEAQFDREFSKWLSTVTVLEGINNVLREMRLTEIRSGSVGVPISRSRSHR